MVLDGHEDWAYDLAADMRDEDRAEVMAVHASPFDAAVMSFRLSEWSRVVVQPDGVLVAAYGIGRHSMLDDAVYPWLLTTNRIRDHWRAFARGSREVVAYMREKHPTLVNYVHAPYRTSIEWLKWLGANVSDEPEMIRGEPFLRFEWVR